MENTIKVGDKGTILFFSDRDPVTVVEVKGKRVCVQRNKVKNISLEPYQNEWKIFDELLPGKIWFSLRKNGQYRPIAENQGGILTTETHYKYYDYGF